MRPNPIPEGGLRKGYMRSGEHIFWQERRDLCGAGRGVFMPGSEWCGESGSPNHPATSQL